ncbi:hypothetical protein GJ744_003370 [Endocarpon pusillum]|uniref:Uncharacterized protein n=1 Tax=Endocarpon pusillum TaxID=364733 RepID=A0A8H7AAQ0_9EURO|nr:hypothetical protein GJ744_003370 [Endocarpon pusillum]
MESKVELAPSSWTAVPSYKFGSRVEAMETPSLSRYRYIGGPNAPWRRFPSSHSTYKALVVASLLASFGPSGAPQTINQPDPLPGFVHSLDSSYIHLIARPGARSGLNQ